MCTLYSPFCGVEIVAPVAYVLDKTERVVTERNEHEARWGVGRQGYGVASQIAYSLSQRHVHHGIGVAVEYCRERQRLVG